MDRSRKEPFDFPVAMRRLRSAVRDRPKAAMFEPADEGFDSLFEQLVACILSIRTFEEVTLATARRLFAEARTPAQVAALSTGRIDELIHACTFHTPKARQIRAIAERFLQLNSKASRLDRESVLQFAGVGPKCANLAVGISSGRPVGIPVDVHVHRVVNRRGVVQANSPERTMIELEKVLPRRYWLEINKLLVPFGRHVCRAIRPRCPSCPLLSMCRQIGVHETEDSKGMNPSSARRRADRRAAADA